MDSPSSRLARLGDLLVRCGLLAQEIRENLTRELKADGSIVTIADRTVEEFLRRELPIFEPGSTVWGEEYGYEEEGEAGLWAVDPIDGTSNYSFGSPLWGVSAALVVGEDVVLGGVYLPDLEELYLAELGRGAFVNGKSIEPIVPGAIRDEELVSYSDYLLRDFPDVRFPGRMRCSGAFVVDGTFVARQRYRALIGIRERLYDVAACIVINRELGAEIRYADGSALSVADLKNTQILKPWVILPAGAGFHM